MARQLLIETKMNALSLCEGVQSKSPNSLGVLKGPCADYNTKTRNGNFYSRKLWENVFKSDLVKEALQDKVLFGELDHPETRLETSLKETCMVMTGYSFDDNSKSVIGTFEILPTPNGKLLKSILDCGCKIGVSSRGDGEVTESTEGNVVDENNYYFVGFDAVAIPAVKKAKPVLQESLHARSFKESLESQISSAASMSELNTIKRVIEASSIPDSDSLIESINIKSKELEGTNRSSDNLMEDLEKSVAQVNQLTEENRVLKQEVVNCNSKIERLTKSNVKLMNEQRRVTDKLDSLESDYTSVSFELSDSTKKTESLTARLHRASCLLDEAKEAVALKDSAIESKEKALTGLQEKVSRLEESLEKSQNSNRERATKVKDLEEKVSRLTDEYNLKLEKLSSEYEEKLKKSESKVSQLSESLSKTQTQLSQSKQTNDSVLREYAEKRSKDLGINPRRVLESLKPGMQSSDVDSIIDEEVSRSDRYRSLGTMDDKLISSLSEATLKLSGGGEKVDEEAKESLTFMERYYNLNN